MKVFDLNNASLEELEEKEWLVANGLGGYASSTICHLHTRRYHGLLVAAHHAPMNRHIHVSKIEEVVESNFGAKYQLSNSQYPGTVSPEGYRFLKEFSRQPMPSFLYEADGFKLKKTIFMVYRSNTTVVEYENVYEHGFKLQLSPTFVERDFHRLFVKDDSFNYHVEEVGKGARFEIYPCYGAKPIHLSFSSGEFEENRYWLDNVEYAKELENGEDFRESMFHLGSNTCYLNPGEKIFVVMSLDEGIMNKSPDNLKNAELERLSFVASNLPEESFERDLSKAGEQLFVIQEGNGLESIIAGYPWNTHKGRDLLIAMRGLNIATGHYERSKLLLRGLIKEMRRGIIPHKFADYKGHDSFFDSVDTSLWLFQAIYEFDQKFSDDDFLREMYDPMIEILNCYIKGTDYNIHLTDEGFIFAGFINNHVTWMDAQTDDFVITPRNGCSVEVNLLWYNALEILEYVGQRIKKVGFQYRYIKELFKENFKSFFWNKKGYLNDLVRPGATPDNRIRPNQIFALTLPFRLLSEIEEKKVLKVVENELLTPFGLRTVAMKDPGFQGKYEGDRWTRDKALHQGTVWAFLLPEYYSAYLRLYKNTNRAKNKVIKDLQSLKTHFYKDAFIHGISEVFDGKEPKSGKGAGLQAMAIGNLLKLLLDNELDL